MSYLNAENLIINCLQAEMHTVSKLKILSVTDLDGIKEQSQLSPAVQVVFYDDQPEDAQKGEFNSQIVKQLWLVTIVIRNVKDKSGENARADAGDIINEVISILNGKHLNTPYRRMVRVKSPYRPTYRNGFFYFPMMFSVRMKTTGRESYTKI